MVSGFPLEYVATH